MQRTLRRNDCDAFPNASRRIQHSGPACESWWRDLGKVTLNKKLKGAIAHGLAEQLGGTVLATSPAGGTTHCWPFNSRPLQIYHPKRPGISARIRPAQIHPLVIGRRLSRRNVNVCKHQH